MTPEALARLHAACFSTPRPWTAAEFAALIADPCVILSAGMAGFALGRTAADEAELLTLAVEPAARRRGLGRALLQGFEAEAAKAGAARAFLEVASGNSGAIALYRSAGYVPAGLRKAYFRAPDGTSHDAIVMVKPLTGD